MQTLKHILKRLRLFRPAHYTDIEVALFLLDEMQNSGKLHGYKMMHLKCIQNGYVVTQEMVRQLMHVIDPEGIDQRRRHRLCRRMYHNLGPNFLWHLDGYDKLKPYGICINEAIDGFSRYIIWLEAYKTNSDPKVVAGYFMEAVKKRQGCPARLRADRGTENSHVKQMLMFMKRTGSDSYVDNCYLEGSSNCNQRIEQWWGFLRKHSAQYWMDFFAMLKDMGCFTGDFLDKALIQFCFMDLVQAELDATVNLWNSHRIRPSKNHNVPSGRPVVMYTCKELYGAQDYLCSVTDDEVNACLEECTPKGPFTCDETVFELCSLLMEEEDRQKPHCAEEAALLYHFLRDKILEGLS
ncbi:hypothetical protein AOXY_G36641 [Acipenser oxyrinchus oxyrinchus]|uniref:Integrase core domain-containing protein n=1 Tax=Acipenser oxyrinchus oxyrinchus TaxID=40147 RepID=A0AAD8CE91_ACIOX|nr:hypothetical protein AOXY_G36641 [Acipenser oxyrinchus oxyrinchus]